MIASPLAMNALVRIGQLLAVNAVPAWGFLAGEWTAATALLLYWLENLASTFLIAFRIVVHRRRTRKRGHYTVQFHQRVTINGRMTETTGTTTYLKSYLSTSLIFTLAHGLFVVIVTRWIEGMGGVQPRELRQGAIVVGILLLFGLALDLANIGERPFAWIKRIGDLSLGRMMVVHITLVAGMLFIMFFDKPEGLVAIFVILKTMVDVSSRLPRKEAAREAPKWLVRAANRLGPSHPSMGRDFAAFYRKGWEEERTKAEEDEWTIDEGDVRGSR